MPVIIYFISLSVQFVKVFIITAIVSAERHTIIFLAFTSQEVPLWAILVCVLYERKLPLNLKEKAWRTTATMF